MFKEDYKAANDSIHADGELTKKILEASKKPKKRVYKFIPAAAAAVVIVSASFAAMPHLMNKDDSGVLYSETTTQDNGKETDENKGAKPQNGETDENLSTENAVPADEPSDNGGNDNAPQEAAAEIKTTVKPKATTKPKATPAPAVTASPKPEKTPKATKAPADNTQKDNEQNYSFSASSESAGENYSFSSSSASHPTAAASKKSLVLSINSSDLLPAADDYGDMLLSSADTDSVSYEDWDNERYFSYLGRRITYDIVLPWDFGYIGDEEFMMSTNSYGDPVVDKRIFPYEGDNGRYVTIMTSKNSDDVYSILHNPNYSISSIYGTDAVIIGTNSGYKCYIIYEGISYIITADGINEDELKQILTSVTKEV